MPASSNSKGTGLNSIPVRFGLMSAVFMVLVAGAEYALLKPHFDAELYSATIALAGIALIIPPIITFLAANKLAGMIRALRASTEAIIEGDIDSPVDVDCACEVGGLADSFRAMVARLNANILRMNVLAYTDSVTGLPNRSVINHIISLSREQNMTECVGAMMFIDLDGFKRVNDTFGHDIGDELLREVSTRILGSGFGLTRADIDSCTTTFGELCTSCPTKLVLARFAGDEFLVILPKSLCNTNLEDHASKIIESISQTITIQGHEIHIGASVGIAVRSDDTGDLEDLLIHSDIAMYAAKENGKNGYRFFDRSLKDKVDERACIEADLHQAIASDELTLHFQPKVDARTMEMKGVEALARWQHPSRGMISPETFIGIAEQSGLMVPLGDSILRMAAMQMRNWLDRGLEIPVAVNVSAVQFEQPKLSSTVLDILAAYQVPPSLLCLEITETVAMSSFTQTNERIEQLRAAGISISIDDFGTGYSNLSQLARLEFDSIKIDRSLVAGIGVNAKSETMLKAIVGMARALGHNVIAEGIETAEQLHFLARIGCDQLQGFMLGKPMPAAEVDSWSIDEIVDPVGAIIDNLGDRIHGAEPPVAIRAAG
ncbi:MAG: EAL domain-containing protein [Sphingobium sp.]|nr:EAL domain-containing protein [Sphingobium sp.]MCP5400244.1 EAL domain-containing protein [Sphingomonas sp.]